MPTYEYSCSECGHTLEIVHKMSDPAPRECPKCKKQSLERLVSNSAFVLKGAGWYADGYGAGKAAKDSPAPKTSPATTSTAPEKSLDAGDKKPEAKPEKTPASGTKT